MDIQDQVLYIHKCDELKSPTDPESALKRALCRFPWVGEERDNYLFEYNSLFRTVHSSFKVQSSFILLRVFLCLCVCVCMCEKKYCSHFVRRAGLVRTSPKLWALVWVTFSKMKSEHSGPSSRSLCFVPLLPEGSLQSLRRTSWRVLKSLPRERHPRHGVIA